LVLPNSTVMPYNSFMVRAVSQDTLSMPRDRFRGAYWKAFRDLETLRLAQWKHSRLTIPQLRVLFQVRRVPGITTGELARCLGITMSTASGLVSKLADRGLLARGSSEDDRRQIPLELTDGGLELAGELRRRTLPFLEAVADELGDELDQVVEALEKLAAASSRARER
jgi:DNA-binding MarR family transcriptional regulator